jgi:hypothetical protein
MTKPLTSNYLTSRMFRRATFVFLTLALLLVSRQVVFAQLTPDDQFLMEGQVDYGNADVKQQTDAFTGKNGAEFGRVKDPRLVVASIVQSFLVLLGSVFLAYSVYAGYLILTSAGNEDRIEKGKTILRSTTVGILIVLSAYSAMWLVRWLSVASGDDSYKDCAPPVYEDFNGDPLSDTNAKGQVGYCP